MVMNTLAYSHASAGPRGTDAAHRYRRTAAPLGEFRLCAFCAFA